MSGVQWRDIVTKKQPKLMARWRTDLKWPDAARPIRINVAVKLQDMDLDWLPTPAEVEVLNGIEHAMVAVFDDHNAPLTLVLTTDRMREWVAYTDDVSWLDDWEAEFVPGFLGDRQYGVAHEADPEWSTYALFAGNAPKVKRRWIPRPPKPDWW